MAKKMVVTGNGATTIATDEETEILRGVQGLKGDTGNQGIQGIKGDPLSVPPSGFSQIDNAFIDSEGNLIVVYNE